MLTMNTIDEDYLDGCMEQDKKKACCLQDTRAVPAPFILRVSIVLLLRAASSSNSDESLNHPLSESKASGSPRLSTQAHATHAAYQTPWP